MTDDVTTGLIRALVDNLTGVDKEWQALSMVLDFAGGRFSGTHGYAYPDDGSIAAVASHPYYAKAAVNAYLESHYKPGDPLPAAILVQFDRTSGQYEVTFEDTDATRWRVTPANIGSMGEQLRPAFD